MSQQPSRRFKTKTTDVPVGKLHLHAKANRELRPNRVKALVNKMDLDALGRFAVWRDGRNLYVIDGQHRKVALEQLGLSDWEVRCEIYEGMTFPDACEQFLKLNDAMTVRPFDKFDKGVKAGRMECVETDRIVRAAGLVPASGAGEGKLACPVAALETWKLDQGESLAASLRVISQSWGYQPAALEGSIVKGLGIFASRHNGNVDYDGLIKKLAKYPGGPSRLLGVARSQRDYNGGSLAKNLADAVTQVYNKGRRGGQLT